MEISEIAEELETKNFVTDSAQVSMYVCMYAYYYPIVEQVIALESACLGGYLKLTDEVAITLLFH